jgi:hypothetical protein
MKLFCSGLHLAICALFHTLESVVLIGLLFLFVLFFFGIFAVTLFKYAFVLS